MLTYKFLFKYLFSVLWDRFLGMELLGHMVILEEPLVEGIVTHSDILAEFHGQSSLVGYSPWGGKESDMTEAA